MPRPHAEIDADLTRWTDIAGRIGKAIEGLTQDPAFLRLKAQARLGGLTGATTARAQAAVNAAEQLWTLYLSLDKQLAEAAELRRSNNPFGREERFEKIDAILTGPSVALPSEPLGLAEMTLTGAPDRPVRFAEVSSAMQAAFNGARDTVLAAGRAWAQTGDLAALGDQVRALEIEADALGGARPPALSQASSQIAAALTNLDSDPIGADDARAQVAALIGKANEALVSARADLTQAKAFLAQADARLADLAALVARAAGLRADRIAKISNPAPSGSLPADPTDELRTWLSTLAKTVAAGRPHAALVGSRSWTAQAERCVAELDGIAQEDKRLLDVRDDLRGRFSALSAKARARAAEGRLNAETATLFKQTQALLFGAVSPLPEAVSLLQRCETL